MAEEKFHTFREDMKKNKKKLTASMEDYLEMIYRLSIKEGYTRVYELAKSLNVKPPSATKMIQKLAEEKLLKYEKYGIIILESKGKKWGKILLDRHLTIETLLVILGINKKNILIETERIEHTINSETLKCIRIFVDFINDRPDLIVEFYKYREQK